MRKSLLIVGCVLGLVLAEPVTAGAGPSLAREVAAALKTAQRAEADARAALSAAKRIPVSVKGDTGPKGSDGQNGAAGASGADGRNGTRGADGSAGAIGPQGPRGEQGSQGPKGDTGSQGPAGLSVKAYGHVTATGTGTTTQGTTATHTGNGSYCLADAGFISVVATPDRWNATTFALSPDSPNNSCGAGHWTIIVSSNSGEDDGFFFIAN